MAKKDEQVVEEIQPTEEVKTPKSEIKEEGGDMKVKAPKFPKQFVNDICMELQNINYAINKLYSIKIELKENHIASASYIKTI